MLSQLWSELESRQRAGQDNFHLRASGSPKHQLSGWLQTHPQRVILTAQGGFRFQHPVLNISLPGQSSVIDSFYRGWQRGSIRTWPIVEAQDPCPSLEVRCGQLLRKRSTETQHESHSNAACQGCSSPGIAGASLKRGTGAWNVDRLRGQWNGEKHHLQNQRGSMVHKETWKCVAWLGARSVGPTCVVENPWRALDLCLRKTGSAGFE